MGSDRRRGEMTTRARERDFALNLHYNGQPLMNVLGPITGRAYEFSGMRPEQPVDLRDARFLLASPLFKLSR